MLNPADSLKERHEMVERAIRARGVRSELVLEAMRSVPREDFLPERMREFAYEDTPLPIEADPDFAEMREDPKFGPQFSAIVAKIKKAT